MDIEIYIIILYFVVVFLFGRYATRDLITSNLNKDTKFGCALIGFIVFGLFWPIWSIYICSDKYPTFRKGIEYTFIARPPKRERKENIIKTTLQKTEELET
jgi:hypothetical protein